MRCYTYLHKKIKSITMTILFVLLSLKFFHNFWLKSVVYLSIQENYDEKKSLLMY